MFDPSDEGFLVPCLSPDHVSLIVDSSIAVVQENDR